MPEKKVTWGKMNDTQRQRNNNGDDEEMMNTMEMMNVHCPYQEPYHDQRDDGDHLELLLPSSEQDTQNQTMEKTHQGDDEM